MNIYFFYLQDKAALKAANEKLQSNGAIKSQQNGSAFIKEVNGNTKFADSMSKIDDYCNANITSPTAKTTRQRVFAAGNN